MTNRRNPMRVLAVLAAFGAALATLPAASAATPTTATVTAGAVPAGTALKLTLTSASPPVIKDNRSGFNIQCPTVSMTGAIKSGPNQPPSNIGRITGSTWGPPGQCRAAGGAAQVTHTPSSVWYQSMTKVSQPASAQAASGQITGYSVTGIKTTFKVGSCTFSVNGSVTGEITNGTPSTLTISGSSLGVSDITLSGGATTCDAGFVQAIDTWTILGKWNISATVAATGAAANPLWINAQ